MTNSVYSKLEEYETALKSFKHTGPNSEFVADNLDRIFNEAVAPAYNEFFVFGDEESINKLDEKIIDLQETWHDCTPTITEDTIDEFPAPPAALYIIIKENLDEELF